LWPVVVVGLSSFGCGGGLATAVAFAGHLDDGGVVDEAVDGGDGHGLVLEEGLPLAEGLVAGDDEGSAFVGLGDEFEEDVGLVLVLAGIADVVEDEDIVAVELGENVGELEVAAGGLEMLEEVGDALEAGAVAVGDEVVGDGGGEVGLADTVWSEDEEVVGLLDPVAAGGQFADAWLGDVGGEGEVEGLEGLARRQVGLVAPALDAAAGALLEFVLTPIFYTCPSSS
jgi:hypothetical protein